MTIMRIDAIGDAIDPPADASAVAGPIEQGLIGGPQAANQPRFPAIDIRDPASRRLQHAHAGTGSISSSSTGDGGAAAAPCSAAASVQNRMPSCVLNAGLAIEKPTMN